MNLIDCTVEEILAPPYERYGKWWVDVRYNAWGTPGNQTIMCDTKEEAESIKPGHQFLS